MWCRFCSCWRRCWRLSRPRPPPGSPLFPYTTLFRSGGVEAEAAQVGDGLFKVTVRVVNHTPLDDAGRASRDDALQRRVVHNPDRKSTRLNSSHTVISYAVFCLKKKNCAD